jgi:hypothetical protein
MRIIHFGAPSGRLTRSYAPTLTLIASDPMLNALPMSAPIEIVHPLAASAVHSNVIGGSQSTYHPLSKVIADLRLHVGLVDASTGATTGKRHELVREHAVEPGPLE